ncbi:hypothetical protein BN85300880 [Paracholeplasma brassicae]|uniref:Glycosyltransferase subfamily 4-like N-terminal domain-containing protein n=1 Tax=Acholeplasma brassicae TaxID=61635 RepID=U4KSK7_9MOLU|nr:hypothetical protein [Paracholeplasma brassicae]CCV65109.1 hypothetical protein BN85300880 [Paracholeplasma brassicae]
MIKPRTILFITLDPIESGSSAMTVNRNLINSLVKKGYIIDALTINTVNDVQLNNSILTNKFRHVFRLQPINLNPSIGKTGFKSFVKKELIKIVKKVYQSISVFNYTVFAAKRIKLESVNNNSYDYVISVSDPKTSHIAAKKLISSGLSVKKWIQIWGDPLSIDISNKVITPRLVLKRIEYNLIKNADQIVYVSPSTSKYMKKNFAKIAEKISFIPLPLDLDVNNDKLEYYKKDTIQFSYLGSYHSSIRNIKPLYDSFDNLMNAKLVIAGHSNLTLSSTANIDVMPNQSLSKLREIEDKTDVYVAILNNSGTQIPGKLYYYAGTNKPIMVLYPKNTDPFIINYLDHFKRFWLVRFDEIDNFYVQFRDVKSLYVDNSIVIKVLSPDVITSYIMEGKSYNYNEEEGIKYE